jgi:nicotinate phosphoribosyltransferase
VFLRRPVVSAPALMVDWLQAVAKERNTVFEIELTHPEGNWVGAGEPLAYITGSMAALADLETIFLQKIGAACVAAHNAFQMCAALPHAAFLAMDARHCAGGDMQEIMAYAAAVGSRAAQREGAKGFVGNANDWTAHYFGAQAGYGTMPHALIGYAGTTLRAAEMFAETFPDEDLTVLVDYFGKEITDGLAVCRRFPEMATAGRIVASSGFGVEKCSVMADAHTPIDVVGTGSFIPEQWSETYATADIVSYDGVPMVKIGREFLLRSAKRDLG